MIDIYEPPWLIKARKEIGVAEIPGLDKNNPRILEYDAVTTLKAKVDEVPWCSAFVCAMLEWSGVDSTKSAAAVSYLDWGIELDKPSLGCIVVLERKGGHHVGFYLHETMDAVTLLGGNQSDKVCEMRFPKSLVLSYRLPDEDHWHPENESIEDDPKVS